MIKNNIQYIFLDIDGTLLTSKKLVTDYTKKVIYKIILSGKKVILVSGRSIERTTEIAKLCNTSPIIISDNGSVIYNYIEDKFLYFKKYSKNNLRILYNLSKKYNFDIIFNSKNKRFRIYSNLDMSYNEFNDIVINNLDDINDIVFQIVIIGNDKNKINELLDDIKKIDTVVISNYGVGKNDYFFVDINLKNISKGIAIKKLCKMYNIKKQDTMCFGDSINDLQMFYNCGIKVAMKNSIDELKKEADYVTKFTSDENGVALFLEDYFR